MKHMRKVFALALTLIMALALTVPAFAADDGSITINHTENGKSYDLFKIFDLTYTTVGEGEAAKTVAAYTIDNDWTAFFVGDGAGYIVPAQPSGVTLNPIIVGGVKKYINITESNVAEFAQAALNFAATKNADQTVEAKGTSVTVTGLELGYYLVFPVGASEIKDSFASLCSLTSTIPNGEVNIKAEYPEIVKTANKETAQIGEVVTYTITGEVPDTTGFTTYEYTVSDTMSAGLTFNKDVTVEIADASADTIYPTPTYANTGFTLTFDMTKYQTLKGKAITITYTATVNENAVTYGNDGMKNSATLSYSNDPADSNSKTTNPPEIVTVYSADIIIDKYDATNSTGEKKIPLAGAKFVLKNSAGKYYSYDETKDEVIWVSTIEGVAADEEKGTKAEPAATVVTTNADGAARFDGLAAGTYNLVEIEAPAGYNMLTEEKPVLIGTVENETTHLVTMPDATATIGNNTGSLLPSTGGIGTTIFYMVGGILMAGAAILLITKKKMSNEQ